MPTSSSTDASAFAMRTGFLCVPNDPVHGRRRIGADVPWNRWLATVFSLVFPLHPLLLHHKAKNYGSLGPRAIFHVVLHLNKQAFLFLHLHQVFAIHRSLETVDIHNLPDYSTPLKMRLGKTSLAI